MDSQTTSGCLDPVIFPTAFSSFTESSNRSEDPTTPAADDVFRSQGKTGALEQGVFFLQIFGDWVWVWECLGEIESKKNHMGDTLCIYIYTYIFVMLIEFFLCRYHVGKSRHSKQILQESHSFKNSW